MILEIDYSTHT